MAREESKKVDQGCAWRDRLNEARKKMRRGLIDGVVMEKHLSTWSLAPPIRSAV
jgi:hypothetical protein